MALTPGTRLGHYDVVAQIGVGGMGEVYRATDTNLKRQVALKVLPDAVAADADRLARFQREAEVLAALNHPNIAQIHGIEKAGGTIAIVMELVEGPTLADRIADGPIPVDEALPIARQITEALEAAHEQGIIHRDLKPANVKVRPDGTVKVLDFGLAKAMEPAGGMSPGVSQLPTITTPAMTQAGMILGTAAYMSPEQARGRATDRRTDVWAFGAVLYEMLTGRRAFHGEDVTDTVAAVVRSEPDWAALGDDVPPRVQRVLRLCLQKNSQQRVGDIAAIRLALDGAFETAAPQAAAAPEAALPSARGTLLPVGAAVAATVLVGALAAWTLWPAPEPRRVSRFEIATSPEASPRTVFGYSDLAISPDGSRIAYTSGTTDTRVWVREIDELEATPLPGSEGVSNPVFSPDGDRVGFHHFQDRTWRQASVRGGPVSTIVDLAESFQGGASWGADGTLVYGSGEGLWQVPATGGTPELLTKLSDRRAGPHSWPDVLPDGSGVLFAEGTLQGWQIMVVSRATGEVLPLVPGGSHPRYASSGHIVYASEGGTLWAVGFDAARLAVTGTPVPVVEGVSLKSTGAALFDISQNGSLVYLYGGSQRNALEAVWVDRSGRAERIETVPAGPLVTPRLSPDGSRVLLVREGDAWVYDLADGRSTRLTTDGLTEYYVAWDPTGARVAFSSSRGGAENNIWAGPVDGSGAPELLVDGNGGLDVESWSADGRVLLAHQHTADQGEDLVTIPLDGATPEVRPFLANEFGTAGTVFSPDGRYIAYTSDESGRQEVYVRPFPGPGGQVTASVGGGREPAWGRNGELFYRRVAGDRLMAVAVQQEPGLRLSAPVELFSGDYHLDAPPVRQYDVTADGQRFLMLRSPVVDASDGAAVRPKIVLVENFFEELKRLVPTN